MDIRKDTENLVLAAVKRRLDEWGVRDPLAVALEVPRLPEHGDFSTNAALQAARIARRPPREMAAEIAAEIRREDRRGWIKDISVAGPGFINLRLSDDAWRAVVAAALREGDRFGASDQGKGEKILLEFVSANPTGPLHIGHGRGAAVGDALARIFAFAGYAVSKEYYVNDVGNQMDNLGLSLFLRYLQLHGCVVDEGNIPYKGEYLRDIAARVVSAEGRRFFDALPTGVAGRLGGPPSEPDAAAKGVIDALNAAAPSVHAWFRETACETILSGIRDDLGAFRVTYDRWFRERELHDAGDVASAVDELRAKGCLYDADGAVYFRSVDRGDEKDRVLVRADGRSTYFAADVAYHRDKFRRGFDRVVNLWGADHHGYAPRLRASLEGLGVDPSRFEVLLVQFVTLLRGGKAVQMSTRSGEFETLRDLLADVGTDVARFFYLMRSCHAHLDFDIDLAETRSSENPVYYVQYVHARICSIFREAETRGVVPEPAPHLSVLAHPEELRVMKTVARFPDVVSEAARLREPHRIPFYLIELSKEFHAFYHGHRFLGEAPEKTQARLGLAAAVRTVVANGLSLIGVSAPERM